MISGPLTLTAEQLSQLFPHYIATDRNFVVLSRGASLADSFPELCEGASLFAHALLLQPNINPSAETLRKHSTNALRMRLIRTSTDLQGQFLWLERDEAFLFLLSPLAAEDPFERPPSEGSLTELVSARDRALAENRTKSEFLAAMSHEIRTPMNGIIATADMLLESKLNFEQRDLAETLRSSSQSLLSLLNGVLDYSKLESSTNELETVPCDLVDLAEEVLELFWASAKSKGLDLTLDFAFDQNWQFMADPGRIRQVLSNLVGNALKFTKQGAVTIRLLQTAGKVRIEVEDTGIGFDEAVKARLFEPFMQAESGIQRRFGGTGLGLAICRKTVQLWGGEIDARSVPGKGTVFWFDHPANACDLDSVSESSRYELPAKVALEMRESHLRFRAEELLCWMGIVVVKADSQAVLLTDNLQKAAENSNVALLRAPVTARRIRSSLRRVQFSSAQRQRQMFGRRAPLVLLAEDNLINRKIAVMLLRRLGCQCDIACDGQQAVQAVQKRDYAVVLMDTQMPIMSGLEATKYLRQLPKGSKLSIIALTANSNAADREACLAAGAYEYLTKPIDAVSLANALSRCGLEVQLQDR